MSLVKMKVSDIMSMSRDPDSFMNMLAESGNIDDYKMIDILFKMRYNTAMVLKKDPRFKSFIGIKVIDSSRQLIRTDSDHYIFKSMGKSNAIRLMRGYLSYSSTGSVKAMIQLTMDNIEELETYSREDAIRFCCDAVKQDSRLAYSILEKFKSEIEIRTADRLLDKIKDKPYIEKALYLINNTKNLLPLKYGASLDPKIRHELVIDLSKSRHLQEELMFRFKININDIKKIPVMNRYNLLVGSLLLRVRGYTTSINNILPGLDLVYHTSSDNYKWWRTMIVIDNHIKYDEMCKLLPESEFENSKPLSSWLRAYKHYCIGSGMEKIG